MIGRDAVRLQPGAVFAGFTVERVLGAGGMGTVYLAQQPRLRRRVALKVLTETFGMDPKTRSAFDREAAVAAGLDHPNIVPVYDRSPAGDPSLWLTMRYIDGGDVAALLDVNPGGLAPARAVRILADAARALDYAHAQGVLHRDVKPANLLIDNDQRHGECAVLTDFGIARTLDDTVTMSGIAVSFAYAAPERFTSADSDHRADIYSLGCTLFQLLTGQPPFPRKDQAAVVGAHLTAAPPAPRDVRPGLPAELDAVIATALAKAPQERYSSCRALAEAATRALSPSEKVSPTVRAMFSLVPLHIGANPQRRATKTRSSARRRITVVSGLLLAAVGLTVGIVFATHGHSGSAQRKPPITVAPQQITPTATPIRRTTPPASPPPVDTSLATAEQPATEQPTEHSQPTVTAASPRSITSPQPPAIVPQTRSFQWTG